MTNLDHSGFDYLSHLAELQKRFSIHSFLTRNRERKGKKTVTSQFNALHAALV